MKANRPSGQRELLDDLPGTTYLDHVMASMAAGLAEARVGHRTEALHWLGLARDTADGTGDVVAQAITRLAEATGLSGLGESTAAEARAEAQVRLDELGLAGEGLGHRVRPGGRCQRDPRRRLGPAPADGYSFMNKRSSSSRSGP